MCTTTAARMECPTQWLELHLVQPPPALDRRPPDRALPGLAALASVERGLENLLLVSFPSPTLDNVLPCAAIVQPLPVPDFTRRSCSPR